jgi:hypothetical protein
MYNMANKRFWLGMLVVALTFGMMVIGCDNGDDGNSGGGKTDPALNGTWQRENNGVIFILTYNNGSYEEEVTRQWGYSGPVMRGPYSTSSNVINMDWENFQYNGVNFGFPFESRWYSHDEYYNVIKSIYESDTEEELYALYHPTTTYSVSESGNMLTLTSDYNGYREQFTRTFIKK